MNTILKLVPTSLIAAGLFLGCGGEHAHDHDHDGDGIPDHGPGEHQDGGGKKEGKEGAAVADDYPLKTCVVSGEELGGAHGEAFPFVHEGRTVKFCCEPCKDDFLEDPAKYFAMIDAAKDGEDGKAPVVEENTAIEGESKGPSTTPSTTEGENK